MSRGAPLAAVSSELSVRPIRKALYRLSLCERAARHADMPRTTAVRSATTRLSQERTSRTMRSGNSSNTTGRWSDSIRIGARERTSTRFCCAPGRGWVVSLNSCRRNAHLSTRLQRSFLERIYSSGAWPVRIVT